MSSGSITISRVAKELGLSIEEAERRAIELLVRDELRKVIAEKQLILNKYKVSSFEELMDKVEAGELSDVDIHDDIVRLDYLEYREKSLRKMLKELV